MDMLSLIVLVLAIIKRDKRCLPVCIVACVFAVSHTVFKLPSMQETVFFDVFSVISIPFLIVLLAVCFIVFRKPFESGKKCISPIVFSAAILLVKVVRKVFYHYQVQQLFLSGPAAMDMYDFLAKGCTVLDSIYALLFLGFMISIIIVLNRSGKERIS